MRDNAAEPPGPDPTGAGGDAGRRGTRAGGLAGPTRRFAVIVVLLVALASLPTLAAIRAGSAVLDRTDGAGQTTPFIAQPSDVPIVVVPRPVEPPSAVPPQQVPSRAAEPARSRPRRDRPAGTRPPSGRSTRSRVESAPVRKRGTPPRDDRVRRPATTGGGEPDTCGTTAALGWRPLSRQAPLPRCR